MSRNVSDWGIDQALSPTWSMPVFSDQERLSSVSSMGTAVPPKRPPKLFDMWRIKTGLLAEELSTDRSAVFEKLKFSIIASPLLNDDHVRQRHHSHQRKNRPTSRLLLLAIRLCFYALRYRTPPVACLVAMALSDAFTRHVELKTKRLIPQVSSKLSEFIRLNSVSLPSTRSYKSRERIQSVLRLLISSYHTRIRGLLPYVSYPTLALYFGIYQIDLAGKGCQMLGKLSHREPASVLKPLMLPNDDDEYEPYDNTLYDPPKMFKLFVLLRKILLCVFLSLMETEQHEDESFRRLVAEVFGVGHFQFLATTTRLELLERTLTACNSVMCAATVHLNDTEAEQASTTADTLDTLDALCAKIKTLHPYELREIKKELQNANRLITDELGQLEKVRRPSSRRVSSGLPILVRIQESPVIPEEHWIHEEREVQNLAFQEATDNTVVFYGDSPEDDQPTLSRDDLAKELQRKFDSESFTVSTPESTKEEIILSGHESKMKMIFQEELKKKLMRL